MVCSGWDWCKLLCIMAWIKPYWPFIVAAGAWPGWKLLLSLWKWCLEKYHACPLCVLREAKRLAGLRPQSGSGVMLLPVSTEDIANECKRSENRIHKSLLFWERKGEVKQWPDGGWTLLEQVAKPLKRKGGRLG